ncbi:MAG TPA: hypothetical protein VMQ48_02310 [Candidatus Saccharimonadales bacterium]|nr:hypothetical protein [Candidatus Saccharimonadales bacterium]
MLDKLKKHSVKIFVFTINILLAAIVVLIIREKDQARLLENFQKELPANENAQSSSSLPSFENSVSTEGAQSDSSQANVSETSPSTNNSVVVPNTPAPATTPVSNSSNAKTKTS